MQTLLQDLRYGVRMLIRKPGFTLIAVITLGLGIGANTAIFSVINAVLLRPLPYGQPERLVAAYTASPSLGAQRAGLSKAEFIRLRQGNRSFADLAGWDWGDVARRERAGTCGRAGSFGEFLPHVWRQDGIGPRF